MAAEKERNSLAVSRGGATEQNAGLWRLRDHVPGLVIIAVGMLATVVGVFALRRSAVESEQLELERRAAGVSQTLQVSLDVWSEVLEQLTTFFESSTEVTRDDFRDFAHPVLERHPELGGLGWSPLVKGSEREAVEVLAQQDGFGGFQIRALGPSGMLERQGERSEYLPVLFLEPPNEMALGLDLYFSEERRTPADQARDIGRPVASQRRNMVQDPPNVYTIVLHSPVYRRGAPLDTLDQRRAAFVGVTIELLRIDDIVHHALSDADLTNLDVSLVDLSASGDNRTLWHSDAQEMSDSARHWSTEFSFADRRWALSFASEPRGLATAALPWWPMVLSFGASVLLAGVVSAHRMATRLRQEIDRAKAIGAYKLLRKIHGGGMAAVYRARHVLLRRPTALKVFNRPHRDSELRRFEREVRLTASLSHPNTIVIFDYGRTEDNLFYYAMEYIDGLNLEKLVRQYGPLPPGRVIRIMRQACAALAEAHGVGLIHRDIKPSNIMVSDRGGVPDMVKVLDFGLVKKVNVKSSLSEAGSWQGTPTYLAPESINHPDQVDQRVDIYALGLVMHYLLTGERPVQGNTLAAIFYQVVEVPLPRPSELKGQVFPVDLEDLIMQCVEKDPDRRPATVVEMEQRLLELDTRDWSDGDAREWWAHHREQKKTTRTIEPVPRELTVDLEDRQPTVPHA